MGVKILRCESEVSQPGIKKLLRETTQLFLRILKVETQGLCNTAHLSHRRVHQPIVVDEDNRAAPGIHTFPYFKIHLRVVCSSRPSGRCTITFVNKPYLIR